MLKVLKGREGTGIKEGEGGDGGRFTERAGKEGDEGGGSASRQGGGNGRGGGKGKEERGGSAITGTNPYC